MSLAAADFNGDSKLDLVVPGYDSWDMDLMTNTATATVKNLYSPSGYLFDVDTAQWGYGELLQGTANAFDGLNRLQVGGQDYSPTGAATLEDGGRTAVVWSYDNVTIPAGQTVRLGLFTILRIENISSFLREGVDSVSVSALRRCER